MKVLFAVNSESISDAIIKKYQKDYREILSYKNVYYFNAIQKEIQNDKTYDRIVISVDLEPFSNNNYESIDKFIFEKLDGISDEAHDAEGKEISIILICSDRHAKGSSFLVKLFGIGVYNALLGNDRSMEEVCRLISKPRTKKEAKMYYKIDTDDVNYRAENEDEVDELQIQNILFHFKKLGRNTEKYASSFENIAAQYTEEQLKIIINCLPANVKSVLENTSSKYQEIMAASGVMVQGIKSSSQETKEDKKRTGLKIDIIENKLNQTKMTQPIVIPNSVKSTKSTTAKKVISVPQPGQTVPTPVEPIKPERATKKVVKEKVETKADTTLEKKDEEKPEYKIVRLPNGKLVKKRIVRKQPSAEENVTETKTVKPTKKIVETQEKKVIEEKEKNEDLADIELPDLDFTSEIENNEKILKSEVSNIKNVEETEPTKKRRGRPRKEPVETEVDEKPKGKRGRPRKVEIEQAIEEEDELPDLETITEAELNLNSFEEDILGDLDTEIEENSFDEVIEEDKEVSQEFEFPELDDLDDINEFDDEDEAEIEEKFTEEAFDEFNDYDEYGEYETKTQAKKEDIDELFEEDILSDIDDLESEIDLLDDNEVDSEIEIEETQEDDNLLISDLDDEDDLLAAVGFDEEMLEVEEEVQNQEDDYSFNTVNNYSNEPNYVESENNYTGTESLQSIESSIDYSMSNLNSLMTKDKKIVTFLGSTKNGVSFLVNNLAEIFASVGINTAILDMTKNRNSYYIYTQNEEKLRQIAYTSIDKLQNGVADGIRVKQNLTVYTALPNDGKEYPNVEGILSTLVQNHSLVLIDCDFETDPGYFASCQEIYLVQSMDILTIQPLTAFLRDLKTRGVFEPEKVRVVINKELKVRGLTSKAIIGGMSSYNDPAMSFMTELFNKDIVKYCSIPFEEMAYSKYLEGMLNCKVTVSGYSKNFMSKLRILGDMVYPLTSRQTYSSNPRQTYTQNNFSSSMNDTLNKMKKKY